MLVLTRKVGEQIVISKDIVITVTRVKGNRIMLAIEAPKSVPIVRGELPDQPQVNGGAGAVVKGRGVFPWCV